MVDIMEWPDCVLRPQTVAANLVPFTRTGGRSLGGIEPAVRTDLGFWQLDYMNVVLRNSRRDHWQAWLAIAQVLGGRSGRIAVPVKTGLTAPYASGSFESPAETAHSDDSLFDDDTPYTQSAISAVSVGLTPMGATTIRIRVVAGSDNISGTLFSTSHALYLIGQEIERDGNIRTVRISPTVRQLIPADTDLEFDKPTCICRLLEDRGMDVSQERVRRQSYPSVSFVEDTDYWNKLALGLI